MPDTNLAVMTPQTTAVVVSNEWEKQLDLIARTVAPGLEPEEFQLFCHVARVRHLDPLQRQIHAVKRNQYDKTLNGGRGGYTKVMTIQTGIDGYRSIANRTGLYMPSDKSALLEDAGTAAMRITMWVKKYHPVSGSWHEFSATAYYREFVQTRKDEKLGPVPNSMWEKMPLNQLTKCAEALALRKGWPEELGGIYVDEEMQHADSPQVLPPEPGNKQTDRTKKELGTLQTSTSPNRGHGNEGTVQTEKTICAECRQENGGHTADCKMNPKNKTKGKQETQQSRAEQWRTREGHDPKVHISLKDAMQLFDLQRDLGIKEEDMKGWLDANFEIQHRHLIRQDQFQLILDTIQKQFGPKPVEQQAPDQQGPDVQDSGLTGLFPEEG